MIVLNKFGRNLKQTSLRKLIRGAFCGFLVVLCILTLKATSGTVIAPGFMINPSSAIVGQTITVTDLTTVMFDCTPDEIIYSWDFGANASPPSAMYTINNPMDPSINAAPAQMVTYSMPGQKTITLTVFAEDDCDDFSEMTTRTFIISLAPVAIPTLSEWGLMLMILLILILGTLKLMQGRWTSDNTVMGS